MALDEAYDKIDRHLRNTLDDQDYAEFSGALDEVYRASPESVPEDWKLVPVEPTQEMMQAGFDVQGSHLYGVTYCAMLAAAPTPPVSEKLAAAVVEYMVDIQRRDDHIAEQSEQIEKQLATLSLAKEALVMQRQRYIKRWEGGVDIDVPSIETELANEAITAIDAAMQEDKP